MRAITSAVQVSHIGERLGVEVVIVGGVCRFSRTKPSILVYPIGTIILLSPSHANQSFDELDTVGAGLVISEVGGDRLLL